MRKTVLAAVMAIGIAMAAAPKAHATPDKLFMFVFEPYHIPTLKYYVLNGTKWTYQIKPLQDEPGQEWNNSLTIHYRDASFLTHGAPYAYAVGRIVTLVSYNGAPWRVYNSQEVTLDGGAVEEHFTIKVEYDCGYVQIDPVYHIDSWGEYYPW